MPFQSEKQRRYLWANEPEIARDWTDTYGSRIKKDDGGIARLGFRVGGGRGMNRTSEMKKDTGMQRKSEEPPKGHPESIAKQYEETVEQLKRPEGVKRALEEFETLPTTVSKQGILEKIQQQAKLSQIKAHKLLAAQKLGWLRSNKAMSLTGGLFNALQTMPDWLEDMTEEEFQQFLAAEKLNPAAMPKTKGDVSRYAEGEDLMGRVFAGGPFDTGNVNTGGGGDGGYRGYRSYEEWLAAQGGGGGGGTTEPTPDTPSDFQLSLTGTADTPDYYVGDNPLASNLAWGETYGVDPRTMGRTSWAADGGRIPAAYGGIMDSSTGRRAYGFGSFFSKIGKAAKKVLKSPIGKAALLGGVGFGLAGYGPFQGLSGIASTIGKSDLGRKLFMKQNAAKNWVPSWAKIGIGAAGALPFFMGGQDEDEDEGFDYEGAKNKYWDEIMRIKSGAMAGTLDPNKFNYLGVKDGGRIGLYAGGQSTPSDYTMEDAMMTTTQDKLGGITDVMKQADLNRQGSVGQFYAAHGGSADDKLMARIKELQDEGLDYNSARAQAEKESQGKAQGGRIGYAHGSAGYPPVTMGQPIQAPQMPVQPPQRPHPMPAPQPNRMAGMNPMMNRPMMNPMGGRRMAQEGGLMDLGGMEKDYRNDGGFVPLGGEEKADDVPARLSKNEFVFTADAVRGAGDGDIDKGAEIMENIMKNLEQGGQISEETQGLSGAQEMFGVSERLGEVL